MYKYICILYKRDIYVYIYKYIIDIQKTDGGR